MAQFSKSVDQQKISESTIPATSIFMGLKFRELPHLMAFYLLSGILLLEAVVIGMFFSKARLNRRSRDYMRVLEFRKLSSYMYMEIPHILVLQQQWEPIEDPEKAS